MLPLALLSALLFLQQCHSTIVECHSQVGNRCVRLYRDGFFATPDLCGNVLMTFSENRLNLNGLGGRLNTGDDLHLTPLSRLTVHLFDSQLQVSGDTFISFGARLGSGFKCEVDPMWYEDRYVFSLNCGSSSENLEFLSIHVGEEVLQGVVSLGRWSVIDALPCPSTSPATPNTSQPPLTSQPSSPQASPSRFDLAWFTWSGLYLIICLGVDTGNGCAGSMSVMLHASPDQEFGSVQCGHCTTLQHQTVHDFTITVGDFTQTFQPVPSVNGEVLHNFGVPVMPNISVTTISPYVVSTLTGGCLLPVAFTLPSGAIIGNSMTSEATLDLSLQSHVSQLLLKFWLSQTRGDVDQSGPADYYCHLADGIIISCGTSLPPGFVVA